MEFYIRINVDEQYNFFFLINMLSLYYHFQIGDRSYKDKLVAEDNNKKETTKQNN